jgi:hypothetical protein
MGYLQSPSRHAAPVMLRSLHLPREYANPAPGLDLPYCCCCNITVHRDDEGQVSEAELRWRRICHYICGCAAIPAAIQARHDFRTAMTALALRSDMQIDVPLSVLDVSLRMDRRALTALTWRQLAGGPLPPQAIHTGATAARGRPHIRFTAHRAHLRPGTSRPSMYGAPLPQATCPRDWRIIHATHVQSALSMNATLETRAPAAATSPTWLCSAYADTHSRCGPPQTRALA